MRRLPLVLLMAGVLIIPSAILVLRGCARRPLRTPTSRGVEPQGNRKGHFVPPKIAPPPASTDEIGRVGEDVRLRSTLRNYRVALAAGNGRMAAALKKVLLRDRMRVLDLAQEDRDRAVDAGARELAQKTLDSLENRP